MAISCIDIFIEATRIAVKANVKRAIMSAMQLMASIHFQMNYKTELMTHIRKEKQKVEPEIVCRRRPPLHSPHRIAPRRSISRIKANETERKSECFGLIIIDLICIPLDNDDSG